MPAALVIEHLDVIEERHLRFAEAGEAFALFTLDRREEALDDGVVVAVAAATHAAGDAARVEEPLVVLARVGAALVRMVEQPGLGTAPLQRHLERFDGQMPIIDRA